MSDKKQKSLTREGSDPERPLWDLSEDTAFDDYGPFVKPEPLDESEKAYVAAQVDRLLVGLRMYDAEPDRDRQREMEKHAQHLKHSIQEVFWRHHLNDAVVELRTGLAVRMAARHADRNAGYWLFVTCAGVDLRL